MEPGRPSRTALGAARMRALHLLIDDDPKILRDPLAIQFLDTQEARRLRATWDSMLGPHATAVRTSVVVRQRFAEDALAAAYARGTRQYVILGAGLDSFALRRPPELGALRVYELDHPDTQGWKRRRLAALGIATPPDLHFVPIDFESGALDAALTAPPFDRAAPAFLSWLSVLFYLSEEAVLATFRAIAAVCAPGSEIAFDLIPPPETLGASAQAGLAAFAGRVAGRGEPIRSHFDPAALTGTLRSMGYGAVSHLSPADATARYLAARSDGLALSSAYGLMTARVEDLTARRPAHGTTSLLTAGNLNP